MTIIYLISLPLIGAAIGWITNWLAVKLIFRPHRPISLLGYTIQGVVPKRRAELARNIGQVVESELISVEDLLDAVNSKEFIDGISEAAAIAIKGKIIDRFPVFVPLSIKKTISEVITDQIRLEIPVVIVNSLSSFGSTIKEKLDFKSMVEERINDFSLERLEQIIFSVSARELRHIEFLGGVLGFIIGLVQAGMAYVISYR